MYGFGFFGLSVRVILLVIENLEAKSYASFDLINCIVLSLFIFLAFVWYENITLVTSTLCFVVVGYGYLQTTPFGNSIISCK